MTFDDLFTLTPDGPNHWTARGAPPTDERVVYGGLVVGQAIVAVSQETRRCHSLHAFFIGGGAKQVPFEIGVERTRDGGSFATRHVQILQGERLLLAGYSSHHDGDDGPQHQATMPEMPPPEGLEDFAIARAKRFERLGKPAKHYLAEQMLELRGLTPAASDASGETTNAFWMRSRSPIRGGREFHQAAIGFASDMGLVPVGLQNHRPPDGETLQTASLDHSIWFHRDADATKWLLYVTRSPFARDGRGLSHGSIFTRDGVLVASVAQEFLARKGRPKSST